MRLTRVRLSVREAMAVVAAVGLLCYAAILWHRHLDSQGREILHSSLAYHYRLRAQAESARVVDAKEPVDTQRRILDAGRTGSGETVVWKPMAKTVNLESRTPNLESMASHSRSDEAARLSEYHAILSMKYKDAARWPWLFVPPDPPRPDGPSPPPSLVSSHIATHDRQALLYWMVFAVVTSLVGKIIFLAVRKLREFRVRGQDNRCEIRDY